MKIEKAIEILNDYLTNGYQMTSDDLHRAMALGREALKRLRATREYPSHVIQHTLIGETLEKEATNGK